MDEAVVIFIVTFGLVCEASWSLDSWLETITKEVRLYFLFGELLTAQLVGGIKYFFLGRTCLGLTRLWAHLSQIHIIEPVWTFLACRVYKPVCVIYDCCHLPSSKSFNSPWTNGFWLRCCVSISPLQVCHSVNAELFFFWMALFVCFSLQVQSSLQKFAISVLMTDGDRC